MAATQSVGKRDGPGAATRWLGSARDTNPTRGRKLARTRGRLMVAFCKDCRYIYTRDYDEMVAEAMLTLKEHGVPNAPYWGCNHPATLPLAEKTGRAFVSCEQMRVFGAPCTPEGVLFEAPSDG